MALICPHACLSQRQPSAQRLLASADVVHTKHIICVCLDVNHLDSIFHISNQCLSSLHRQCSALKDQAVQRL